MSEPRGYPPLPSKGQAGADPYSIPLDQIDPSDPELFATDTLWGYFERLRKEAPVHWYAAEGDHDYFPPYWSVTKFDDIVYVEKHPELFSSEPTIVIPDPDPNFPLAPGFISMDGAKHDAHRRAVQPVASPRNLKTLEPLIRERVVEILEGLPVGETFDWVDRVCPPCAAPWPVTVGDSRVGQITSAAWSPRLRRNVGLALIDRGYWHPGQAVEVQGPDGSPRPGEISGLPFA